MFSFYIVSVIKSYRDYRNYKQDFVRMMDDVYKKSQSIMYVGDKENANTDSALVSTKRSLIFNQFNKELYQKFFLTTETISPITSKATSSDFGSLYQIFPISNPPESTFSTSKRQQFIVSRRADIS